MAMGVVPGSVDSLCVISVGNLSVGGLGKTPTALFIGRHFLSRGLQAAFLSRGYGRRRGAGALRVFSTTPVADAGDEPLMLAKACPRALVVVDADRLRGARQAKSLGAGVLVLDDGFQQRLFLKRDLDLLLLDAEDPGQGGLLPAGSLREPLSQGTRADALIFSGACDRAKARQALSRLPKGFAGKSCFWAYYQPESLKAWPSGRKLALKSLKGRKAAALSGLARPENFEGLVKDLGCDVVSCLRFPDHHAYTSKELISALAGARSQGAEMAVTTEKDATRIPKGFKSPLPVVVLRAQWNVEPKKEFERLLDRAVRKR
jgi:tetraacyldisaccharide 4'-kinase